MEKQIRIKDVGEVDPIGLRCQTHCISISIKTPRQVILQYLQLHLVLAVHELVGQHPLGIFICNLKHRTAVPLDGNDLYGFIIHQSVDHGANGQVLKSCHTKLPPVKPFCSIPPLLLVVLCW